MQEKGNGNEQYSFINEKRKEKPVNRKRLVLYACFTVAMAVVFGLVASLVFAYFRPKFEEMLYPREQELIKIPRDYLDTAQTEQQEDAVEDTQELLGGEDVFPTETALPETETQPEDTAQGEENSDEILGTELTIQDYQKIQNQLYDIGRDANRFVVTVTGIKSDTDWFQNDYERKDQISGAVIADNGTELLILTERKMIADAQEIYVTFSSGFQAAASMKKYDANTGVCILSVQISELDETTRESACAAVLGNSLTTKQGEIVIAVGSPLGTSYSILTGNITSTTNSISTVDSKYGLFTTNIVGNSSGSGVLLNVSGEIIGLVMQQYNNRDEGTLTAVSISELKALIEMLSNNMDMPYLGVELTTVTDVIAAEYDIPKGAYVKDVRMDSPAMAAGIQNGDVITEIDGDAIFTVDGYRNKLLAMVPGETVQVIVKRQGADGYANISCHVEVGVMH